MKVLQMKSDTHEVIRLGEFKPFGFGIINNKAITYDLTYPDSSMLYAPKGLIVINDKDKLQYKSTGSTWIMVDE